MNEDALRAECAKLKEIAWELMHIAFYDPPGCNEDQMLYYEILLGDVDPNNSQYLEERGIDKEHCERVMQLYGKK